MMDLRYIKQEGHLVGEVEQAIIQLGLDIFWCRGNKVFKVLNKLVSIVNVVLKNIFLCVFWSSCSQTI